MNCIHHLKLIARLATLAIPITILSFTLGTYPTFADDNYANTNSTLNGNWVNHGNLTPTMGPGMSSATEQSSVNATDGTISVGPWDSFNGIDSTDHSTATNNGSITTQSNTSYGINSTDSSTATNNGSITTTGTSAVGINSSGNSSVTNNSSINTSNTASHGIVSDDHSTATNSGTITTTGSSSNGIVSKNYSTATNAGTITLKGSGNRGMDLSDHSTGTNNNTISAQGNNNFGAMVTTNSSFTNNGSIETQAASSYGIATSDSTVVNNGSINCQGLSGSGISATRGTTINNGTITTHGDGSKGIETSGNGGIATNNGSIVTNGDTAYGMLINNHASSINNGSITTQGNTSHGLFAFDSTNTNTGTMITHGTDASTIRAAGQSVIYNSGTLAAYASGAHAIHALDQAKVHLQTGTRILAGDVYAAIASAARLYLDGSGTVDFAITGSWQTISKNQEGTWTITRAPAAVRYFINEGTLALATGTNLAANGITLATGSTLALTSGTTATIAGWGSYNQAASSTLALTLNNGGGPYITVPGTANVAGNLSLDVPCSAVGHSQIIIDAGTLNGGFDSITSANPNFSFDAATVAGGLGQQVQVTGVCYTPQYDNSSMGLSSAMGGAQAFLGVPSNRTIGLLSENQEMGEFMVASSEPLIDLVSRRSNGDRYGIYVQPMFNVSKRDAFGSGPGYSANMAGLEIGMDTFVMDDLLLGAFAGYAVTDINFEGLAFAENDSEDQQMYTLGAYGGYRLGNWRLTDTLSFTHIEHESKRNAGLGEMAKGDYDSQMLSNQLLASYVWTVNETWELSPELGLNTTWLYRGSFSETDATNAVEYDDFDKFFAESVLGLRLRGNFEVGTTTLSPYARVSWSHDLGGNDMTVRQTLGTSAVEATQKNDDDRLGLDVGLSLREGDATFTLAYTGEFSDHSESHGLTANMRLEF